MAEQPIISGPVSADPRQSAGRPRVPIRIEEALMAAAMAAMCLITFGNVAVRYLTNISFAFTEEYSISLMVIMTLLGAGVAVAGDRHIRIGYFVERFLPRRRRGVEVLVLAIVAVTFAILAWLGWRMTWDDYRFEVTSPGLGVPQWIYTVWLPVLSAAVAGRAVGRAWRVGRGR